MNLHAIAILIALTTLASPAYATDWKAQVETHLGPETCLDPIEVNAASADQPAVDAAAELARTLIDIQRSVTFGHVAPACALEAHAPRNDPRTRQRRWLIEVQSLRVGRVELTADLGPPTVVTPYGVSGPLVYDPVAGTSFSGREALARLDEERADEIRGMRARRHLLVSGVIAGTGIASIALYAVFSEFDIVRLFAAAVVQ